jgi:hypothetical protein
MSPGRGAPPAVPAPELAVAPPGARRPAETPCDSASSRGSLSKNYTPHSQPPQIALRSRFDCADFGRAAAGDGKIRPMKRRIFLSALGAIPATFFSYGLADSPKTPNFIQYLIAPGCVLSLHVRLSFDSSIWLALWTNGAYYAAIIYLISFWVDAKTPNHHGATSGAGR